MYNVCTMYIHIKIQGKHILTICNYFYVLCIVKERPHSHTNSVIIPNITAQHKDYLIARLKAYKSGKIQHDQMTIVAGMLSDQDIEDVSEWYSRIKIRIFDPCFQASYPGPLWVGATSDWLGDMPTPIEVTQQVLNRESK